MKKLFLVLVASSVLAGLLLVFFHPELHRFSRGVNKYTSMNIPQNYGWKLAVMKLMAEVNAFFPKNRSVEPSTIDAIYNNFERYDYFPVYTRLVEVHDIDSLREAISKAQRGDFISLLPGEYVQIKRPMKLKYEKTKNDGLPIIIGSSSDKKVVLQVDAVVALQIESANVHIVNLAFQGGCKFDGRCEHAIHIKADADNVKIINNDFINFNAAIKSNGEPIGKNQQFVFPNSVQILHNRFVNEWVRDTKSPVTPIDVVGGNNWVVKRNFIADFAKFRGTKTTYGAFLKGGGENGLFQDNIVVCSWKVPYFSGLDARVGLSFGGGGTGASFCQSENCVFEHLNGRAIGNLIMNCIQEPALYINNSDGTQIVSNILVNSLGIDLHHGSKDTLIQRNVFHGNIWRKDAASEYSAEDNLNFFWFTDVLRGELH